MKEKILAQLVAKYPGVSKKFLGLWADKMVAKVTTEEEIEGAVSELENLPVSIETLADAFQKEGDTRVNEAKKKWGTPAKTEPSKTDPPAKDDPPADDTPSWAKTLMQKIEKLETEKVQSTLKERLDTILKEKKIPLSFAKGRTVNSEEDLEALSGEIEKDFTDFKQEMANSGLSIQTPPTGSAATPNQAIDKEIDAWAKKHAAQNVVNTELK